MNIALLGLSADPPHLGHLAVAHMVKEEGYDQVWFLITPHNPFKESTALSYWHRLQLAELLIAGHPAFRISDFEAGIAVKHENTRTHTVLDALHQRIPEANLTFVMGADAWADEQKGFHSWTHFERIPPLTGLLVIPRQPWTDSIYLCPAAKALASAHALGTGPVPQGNWRVCNQPLDHIASSTQVRQELAATGRSEHLLPAQMAYLRKHHLCGL